MESSVSGLVQPGDRVDLLVFLRKNGEVPVTGAKTISARSHCLRRRCGNGPQRRFQRRRLQPADGVAVGQTGPGRDDHAGHRAGRALHDAASPGRRFGSGLRRHDDPGAVWQRTADQRAGPEYFTERRWHELRAGAAGLRAVAGTEHSAAGHRASSGRRAAPPVEKAAEQPPAWTMQILTQDGYREFRWNSMNGLPDEVLQDTSEAPAPPVSRQAVAAGAERCAGGHADRGIEIGHRNSDLANRHLAGHAHGVPAGQAAWKRSPDE